MGITWLTLGSPNRDASAWDIWVKPDRFRLVVMTVGNRPL